jgi:hypothetical protein
MSDFYQSLYADGNQEIPPGLLDPELSRHISGWQDVPSDLLNPQSSVNQRDRGIGVDPNTWMQTMTANPSYVYGRADIDFTNKIILPAAVLAEVVNFN